MSGIQQNWIVTVDGRSATRFACRDSGDGEIRIERLSSISNSHEDEHQRGRPPLLGGAERRSSPSASSHHGAPQGVSVGHGPEEGQRRFVREVCRWLACWEPESHSPGITVFGSPHMIGLLRRESLRYGTVLDFQEGDLSHLSDTELARHPSIVEMVVSNRKHRT